MPVIRWNAERVMAKVGRVALARAQRAANYAQQTVKAKLGVDYPPASRPGATPRRRSGDLQESVEGRAVITRRGVTASLTIGAPYASFLQDGTSRMAARPIVTARDRRSMADFLVGRRAL